jgi:hypothetical protein
MYSVEYDSSSGIVRMSVEGFWTRQTVEGLSVELLAVLSKVKASGCPVLVLSDARDFAVQSAEVGEAFAVMDAQAARLRDRLAMVVSSTLGKMQARRAAGSDIGFFDSTEDAEHWLRTGEDRE